MHKTMFTFSISILRWGLDLHKLMESLQSIYIYSSTISKFIKTSQVSWSGARMIKSNNCKDRERKYNSATVSMIIYLP